MLKRTFKYTDYNGKEREEEYRFNLSKAELLEMELSASGGMEAMLRQLVKTEDNKQIMAIFKEIILKSVGEVSPDGRRFIKNQEIRESFEQSEAFSELFVELATDADAAANFLKGIVPAELAANMKEAEAEANTPALTPVN